VYDKQQSVTSHDLNNPFLCHKLSHLLGAWRGPTLWTLAWTGYLIVLL